MTKYMVLVLLALTACGGAVDESVAVPTCPPKSVTIVIPDGAAGAAGAADTVTYCLEDSGPVRLPK